MTIIDYLRNSPTLAGETAAVVRADLLSETSLPVRGPDGKPVRWFWTGLISKFGKAVISPIASHIKELDPLNYDMLNGGNGVDFSDPEAQADVKLLIAAGVLSEDLGQQILELGIVVKKQWQLAGFPTMPTDTEISDAQKEIARVADIEALYARIGNELMSKAIGDRLSLSAFQDSIRTLLGE